MIEEIDRQFESWLAAVPQPWEEPPLKVTWGLQEAAEGDAGGGGDAEPSLFVELFEVRPESTGSAIPALRRPASFILKYAVVPGGPSAAVRHHLLTQVLTAAVRRPVITGASGGGGSSGELRVEIDSTALPPEWWLVRSARPLPAVVLRLPLQVAPLELPVAPEASKHAVSGGPIRVARGRLVSVSGRPLRGARIRAGDGASGRVDRDGGFELQFVGAPQSVLVTFEGRSRRRDVAGGVPQVLVWEEMEQTDGD